MDINTPFKKYEYKYYYVFVDSYSCEFSKENCTMEQLNSKTMTWIIKEAEGISMETNWSIMCAIILKLKFI